MPDSLAVRTAAPRPFAALPESAGLVSVLVRTYERPTLLRRALASVLAQTLPAFEVVVVNDGGAAGAVDDAVRQVWPQDPAAPPLHLLHAAAPCGRSPAIRVAFDASCGPLVAVLDDDDSWEPDFLSAVTARFREPDGSSLAAVFTLCTAVEERMDDPARLPVPVSSTVIAPPHAGLLALETLMTPWNFQPCASVYRREAMQRVGAWDPGLVIGCDWELHLRLLQEGEIACVPRALSNWHRRLHLAPGSTPLANVTNDQSAYAAFHARHRSALLQAALRREPWLLGPLLLARHHAAEAERHGADIIAASERSSAEVLAAIERESATVAAALARETAALAAVLERESRAVTAALGHQSAALAAATGALARLEDRLAMLEAQSPAVTEAAARMAHATARLETEAGRLREAAAWLEGLRGALSRLARPLRPLRRAGRWLAMRFRPDASRDRAAHRAAGVGGDTGPLRNAVQDAGSAAP